MNTTIKRSIKKNARQRGAKGRFAYATNLMEVRNNMISDMTALDAATKLVEQEGLMPDADSAEIAMRALRGDIDDATAMNELFANRIDAQ